MSEELPLWGDGSGPNPSRLFDDAMAIVLDIFQKLDGRRQEKFRTRLRDWASLPPPLRAVVARPETRAGDRFVGLITSVGWKSIGRWKGTVEPDEMRSLFGAAVLLGMRRLLKFWGPGKKYPQRCPVLYAAGAVRSACWNVCRQHRRAGGCDDG
jgi:hypothetical protein